MSSELEYLRKTLELEKAALADADHCTATVACKERMLEALSECSSIEDWQQKLDDGLAFEMHRADMVDQLRARATAKADTIYAPIAEAEAALATALETSTSQAEFDEREAALEPAIQTAKAELHKKLRACQKGAALIIDYLAVPADYRIARQWLIGSFNELLDTIGGFDTFKHALVEDGLKTALPLDDTGIERLLETGAAMSKLDKNDAELSEVLTAEEKAACAAFITDLDTDLPPEDVIEDAHAQTAVYLAVATGETADGYQLTKLELEQ